MEPYPFFGPKGTIPLDQKERKKNHPLKESPNPLHFSLRYLSNYFNYFDQKKKFISTICNYINSYIMKPSEKCFKVPSPSEVGSFCFHYIWSEDFTPNLTESYPKRKKKLIRFHSSIAVGLHEEYQGYHDRI